MSSYSDAGQKSDNNTELLDVLSNELNEIMTINELTLQKSADLYAQINVCEARQEFVNASLVESGRIAAEITNNAEQRVRYIIARAQKVIGPQREQIACIEAEIAELNRKLKPDNIIEFKPQPSIIDLLSVREERLVQNPQDKNSLPLSQTDIFSPQLHSPVYREFSIKEPQELNNPVKQPELTEIDQNELQMHLNAFVDAHQYEIKDTLNDKIDNPCENKPAINRLQTSNSNFDDVPGEYKLQVLRETLSAREQVKPDISFKEKLGQIFKSRE